MHLNYNKLKNHRDHMQESLEDIQDILRELSKENNNLEESFLMKFGTDSFRLSLVRLREELFGAVGSLLKATNIRVSDFSTNKDFIKKCIALGYFRELPMEFVRDLNKYRNEAAHRYKIPKYSIIKNFYLDNEKYFKQIIEDITLILDKDDNIKGDCKKMKTF